MHSSTHVNSPVVDSCEWPRLHSISTRHLDACSHQCLIVLLSWSKASLHRHPCCGCLVSGAQRKRGSIVPPCHSGKETGCWDARHCVVAAAVPVIRCVFWWCSRNTSKGAQAQGLQAHSACSAEQQQPLQDPAQAWCHPWQLSCLVDGLGTPSQCNCLPTSAKHCSALLQRQAAEKGHPLAP